MKISAALQGKKNNLRESITHQYEMAKRLISEQGLNKQDACKIAGLSYDAFMRRQRMEIYGKDRINQRDY